MFAVPHEGFARSPTYSLCNVVDNLDVFFHSALFHVLQWKSGQHYARTRFSKRIAVSSRAMAHSFQSAVLTFTVQECQSLGCELINA